MCITKCIEYRGDRVRKYCTKEEAYIAKSFLENPEYDKSIFISIEKVFGRISSEVYWYETPLGQKAEYTDKGLLEWLPHCYKELKRLDISHNDIMLQNIVVLPNKDYRLIDLETVRPGGGSFHDWCKINQLMSRILNNTSSNRGAYQSNESFFRQ